MSRYSLNLRSKYSRDEPTTGGGIAQGIQTALDEYQKYREADRTEANTMAAAGAKRLPPGPNDSVRGRVASIGKAIGGLFGRGDEAPVVAPATPAMPGATPPFVDRAPRAPVTGTGGIVPPTDPAVLARGVASANAGPIPMPAPDLVPATNVAPHMPATAAVGAARPAISQALAQEIQPYEYQGVHGARYQVDPLHGARVQAAATQMQTDVKQNEQIQALVDAGMDPKEARARVLNNVVRYDEQFGQRPRSSGITPEEWTRRQDRLQADRKELEQMRQRGQQNSREYQQKSLELREREIQMRADAQANNLEFRAGTEQVRANKEPGPFERDPNEPPSAAQTRARGRAAGQRMQQNAVTDAQRRANGGTDEATKARAAARAQTLKRQGKTDDEIRATLRAEGYRVQ